MPVGSLTLYQVLLRVPAQVRGCRWGARYGKEDSLKVQFVVYSRIQAKWTQYRTSGVHLAQTVYQEPSEGTVDQRTWWTGHIARASSDHGDGSKFNTQATNDREELLFTVVDHLDRFLAKTRKLRKRNQTSGQPTLRASAACDGPVWDASCGLRVHQPKLNRLDHIASVPPDHCFNRTREQARAQIAVWSVFRRLIQVFDDPQIPDQRVRRPNPQHLKAKTQATSENNAPDCLRSEIWG